jgi:hypothetical protein
MKFVNFLWVIFALLDPDPDSKSGSIDLFESGTLILRVLSFHVPYMQLTAMGYTIFPVVSVVRTMFEDLRANGSLLRPADSAAILVMLLRKRTFKSGDHVDYYDVKAQEAITVTPALAIQPTAVETSPPAAEPSV